MTLDPKSMAKGSKRKSGKTRNRMTTAEEEKAATKVRKAAKQASAKEEKILASLVGYYKGECSLGYAANKLKMPLRALMEFMIKHDLPQYWREEDGKKGLHRLAELQSIL